MGVVGLNIEILKYFVIFIFQESLWFMMIPFFYMVELTHFPQSPFYESYHYFRFSTFYLSNFKTFFRKIVGQLFYNLLFLCHIP